MFQRLLVHERASLGMHNITCTTIYFFIFHFKALLILSLRCSDMRRAKSREEQKRETREQSRAGARYTRGKGKRERERKYTSDFSYLFSSLRVLLWLTFSLFFAQIWVHKLKLSRVSRKERFLRDIKFKHFGRTKDIHHVNAERCS